MRLLLSVLLNQANSSLPIPALSLVEVSYSKAYKKEQGILKIDLFSLLIRLIHQQAYGMISAYANGYPSSRRPPVSALSSRVPAALSCLLYTSPSPRDRTRSRMPSS